MAATAAQPSKKPVRESAGRLRSLDGIRAISVALVLLGHVGGTRGFARVNLGIGDYAHLGVVVFFVISGFLITSLLLSEHARTGSISLKLFYARRSLRIFPPAYVYIAVLAALAASGAVALRGRDFLAALTYTANYFPERSWLVGHLWSLSVEEQFYLLWPLTFVALGPRRAPWGAAAMIFLAPAARVFNRVALTGTPYHDLEMFPMVADSIAMGCFLATRRDWLERQDWYLRLFRRGYSLLLLAVVLVVNRYSGYTVVGVFGGTVANACIAILIHRSVYAPDGWAGRVFNWRPLAFAGVLSYSLYLWQQIFLNRNSGAWINAFPQNLVFAVSAALASYYLLEKPLLQLRHRLRH